MPRRMVLRLSSTAPRSTRSTGPTEKGLEAILEVGKSSQVMVGLGGERHPEVGIAGCRVEVRAPGRGAEYRQLPHTIAMAERGNIGAVLFDQRVHDLVRRLRQHLLTAVGRHWGSARRAGAGWRRSIVLRSQARMAGRGSLPFTPDPASTPQGVDGRAKPDHDEAGTTVH